MRLRICVWRDEDRVVDKTVTISMVSDTTSAVLRVLDAAPNQVLNWTHMELSIERQ